MLERVMEGTYGEGMRNLINIIRSRLRYAPTMMTQMQGIIMWQLFNIGMAHIFYRFAPISGAWLILTFVYIMSIILIILFAIDMFFDFTVSEWKTHTTAQTWKQVRSVHTFKRNIAMIIQAAIRGSGGSVRNTPSVRRNEPERGGGSRRSVPVLGADTAATVDRSIDRRSDREQIEAQERERARQEREYQARLERERSKNESRGDARSDVRREPEYVVRES